MMENKKISNSTFWKIIIIIGILISVLLFVIPSFAVEDSYVGVFIMATKVYMPDGSIKIVIYFNETDNTHYKIFDNWEAKHSVQLSNLDEGARVKVWYKDYVFGNTRELLEIDIIK